MAASLAGLPGDPLVAGADNRSVQDKRANKVEDERVSPANNYGFSESTPVGVWSARADIDTTQVNDPYVPVVIAGVRTYAGKGNWGKQLMIQGVTLKNRGPKAIAKVKLGWIIITKEDRNALKNREAALINGYTPLFDPEVNGTNFKKIRSVYLDFVKEAKPLLKSGALNGDLYIRIRVSEVQFADGSIWREDNGKKAFAHVKSAPTKTQDLCPHTICFFTDTGQGFCESDPPGQTFCQRENCSPDDPNACFCNVHPCSLCVDMDGDGSSDCEGDCDDSNPRRFPENAENLPGNCSDGVDNDCDDDIDCNDILCEFGSECSTPTPTPTPSGGGVCRPCSGDPGYWEFNYETCYPDYHWSCNRCTCIRNSPVLIDVNGDGFAMTGGSNGVYFNFNGDGPERTSWTAVGSDDAFLVLDRNGNGTIDDGTELFGDRTPQPASANPHGFMALAVFDKPANGGNGDGFIDRRDAIFSSLRLWQDMNHNAFSESAELHRLAEFGITSLDLNYKEARRRDQYGNEFRYRAKVAGSGPFARYAWDVFLTFW